MHWYWLVCGIFMCLMELGMRKGLIIFFGISAMIAGAAAYFYSQLALRWQMVIFVAAGILLCGVWQFFHPGKKVSVKKKEKSSCKK